MQTGVKYPKKIVFSMNDTLQITTDIVLVDIAGFSLLSDAKQLDVAEIINSYLTNQVHFLAELNNLRKDEVISGFVPTGDGIYIVLNPQVCGYGVFLALSVRNYLLWVSTVEFDGLYSGVRAAANMGTILTFTDANNCRNYIGSGMNNCQRLLSVPKEDAISFCGDTNYVVASETAMYWFHKLYSSSDCARFLLTSKFKESAQLRITDKHNQEHHAYLVDIFRLAGFQPPNRIRPRKRRREEFFRGPPL